MSWFSDTFGPDKSLAAKRIRNKAQAHLQDDQTKLGIAQVTGLQPGDQVGGEVTGLLGGLGADVAAIMGHGTAPSTADASASSPSPALVVGLLAAAGGVVYLATR